MKRSNLIIGHAGLFSLIFIIVLLTTLVLAEPNGPDTITVAGSGRHTNESGAVRVDAAAGNVTALVISQVRSSQAWQGYYGNITGTIVLDDANNQTLYDWSLPSPTGEVYASNSTIVTWGNIFCLNISSNRNSSGPAGSSASPGGSNNIAAFNGSQIELLYGINVTDKDGLNETFNDSYVSSTGFRVGAITIDTTDGCSAAHPYTTEAYSYDHVTGTGWIELLLTDNISFVFTSLVRESANGFQTGSTDTYDFQMLVLENGHSGWDVTTTPYYFFVELA